MNCPSYHQPAGSVELVCPSKNETATLFGNLLSPKTYKIRAKRTLESAEVSKAAVRIVHQGQHYLLSSVIGDYPEDSDEFPYYLLRVRQIVDTETTRFEILDVLEGKEYERPISSVVVSESCAA